MHRSAWHLPRRIRRGLAIAAAVLLGGAMLAFMPLALAPYLLSVRDPLSPADAIVVLGGFPSTRVPAAAALYRDEIAPVIVISGAGDCRRVAVGLIRLGVPDDRLIIECDSISTLENAELSGAILHDHGMRRIVIVTSWWHAARARAVFAKIVRNVEIRMYPTLPSPGWLRVGSIFEATRLYEEYPKWAWYCIEYGICP